MVGAVAVLSGIVAAGAIGLVAIGSRMPSVRATRQGLEIRHILFGRTVARETLDLDRAAIIDLAHWPARRPKWRTMGIGLPSRQIGWFRLNDGSKALVFLAGARTPVLDLPTHDGYRILLESREGPALLTSLRAGAGT